MTIAELSVPGKTFVLGEYAVLDKGPAILFSSEPRFILKVAKGSEEIQNLFSLIAPQSPAGKLIAAHLSFYQQFHLTFIDPYHGLGGMGASSAQFVLFYALKEGLKTVSSVQIQTILSLYRDLAKGEKGVTPSGADLIAQLQGGLCFFYQKNQEISSLTWPFSDINFCLIHTGNKLATHEHLNHLIKPNTDALKELVLNAKESLQARHSQPFLRAVGEYRMALETMDLVASDTLPLVCAIKSLTGVLEAKGCGALGADIVLAFVKANQSQPLVSWCKENQLTILFLGNRPAPGLQWRE